MPTTIQSSFNSGEWSPKLFARVDLSKYRSGAALLSNFFVDYRGGASTRPGTKYVLQCKDSTHPVRLIPFEASFSVGYVLEFGQNYIRFFFQGAPVLETATTITAATPGLPEVFTDTAHGYAGIDWLFIQNNYYTVANPITANSFTLTDLFGNAINTNPFTLPASAQRVYTVASPYTGAELAEIKFAQNVNELILCHPNHPPYVLTLITANNWTLVPIVFGPTISAPTNLFAAATSAAAGTDNVAYVVTAVSADGIESAPTPPTQFLNYNFNNATVRWTNLLEWPAVAGATSYNVYKSNTSNLGPIQNGAQYGFIGNSTDVTFQDAFIAPDFSEVPPLARNPFSGASVLTLTITSQGIGYTSVPTVIISPPPAGGVQATAAVALTEIGTGLAAAGSGYVVGDILTTNVGNVRIQVTALTGSGINAYTVVSSGGLGSAGTPVPANPVALSAVTGSGTGASLNINWGITALTLGNPGTGYTSPPTIAFSNGSGTATATLTAQSGGNPTVPGFFQQRLVLAAPTQAPQTFYMSQPGDYFNFNISSITQPTDAITGTLVSGVLNTIKSMVPQSAGLMMLTDRNNWLINGGTGQGSAISPSAIVANTQSFNGISDVPPIIANFDVLYVQAKGSIVRDSAYNIYANVYTGTDISAIASHLFYGFTVKEWAWAEEPFKVVWAIRSDGVMLTLTFLKEQEFIGWAHSTTNGSFDSVATVLENTATAGDIDAVYMVTSRTINAISVKYIERLAERTFNAGVADAWCVDCGIQYSGAPATDFFGAQFLGGTTVTGLADGKVIPPFVMPTSGSFTLGTPAAKVTIGLGFTCQLQTLPLEIGDPTVQSKVKKINEATIRVADTLGLSIGSDFNHLVPMKDLVQGNVSSMLTGQAAQVVTDLVNGDARTFIDPTYTVPGQYCIQQSAPLPATILGVIPNYTIGDGGQRG